MRGFAYHAPRSLAEAVQILSREGEGGKVLAGGTDLLIQIKERGAVPRYVVSLRDVPEVRQVTYDATSGLRIGAGARLSEVAAHPVVQERYPILVQGASLVGSLQIQNLGTVVGNLCNAAPSADCAPPLVALGASVRIAGPGGERTVPLEEFFSGPGRTVLAPEELVVEVLVPPPGARSGGAYERFTPRQEMDIAVVGVGSVVSLGEGDRCQEVRICLGAVAPTPERARDAERLLEGQELTPELVAEAGAAAAAQARPITDQRGSATYRTRLVEVLTRRTLMAAWQDARG
ncbi:MAG TPA: xanthine dehydrogenase family protein subunit M [Chloroflexota bacterium]|nr:xanthine dehydrogenase family protein subunit M [Chloroflexota bacterium]